MNAELHAMIEDFSCIRPHIGETGAGLYVVLKQYIAGVLAVVGNGAGNPVIPQTVFDCGIKYSGCFPAQGRIAQLCLETI